MKLNDGKGSKHVNKRRRRHITQLKWQKVKNKEDSPIKMTRNTIEAIKWC